MMNRVDKLKEALTKCENYYKKYPEWFPLKAIISQLNYLIDLENKETNDLVPLQNMKIGWIAVRELDGFEDKELIHLLCQIDYETKYIHRS